MTRFGVDTSGLKRESRRALNEARLAAGLPPKPEAPRIARKLAHDDPIVLACKARAGERVLIFPAAERRAT